jgi:Tn3 transposase DDE domain-containing protein
MTMRGPALSLRSEVGPAAGRRATPERGQPPRPALVVGTYSRKNRLYHAFCAVGRVIRTGFLLQHLADPELRSTAQAAINKNESWNEFLKRLSDRRGGRGRPQSLCASAPRSALVASAWIRAAS